MTCLDESLKNAYGHYRSKWRWDPAAPMNETRSGNNVIAFPNRRTALVEAVGSALDQVDFPSLPVKRHVQERITGIVVDCARFETGHEVQQALILALIEAHRGLAVFETL